MEAIDRGSTWADEEILLLISIWANEKIQQQLDSCSRKRPIYEKMAKRLKEEGDYIRSFSHINEKIKQLLLPCYKPNRGMVFCSVNATGFAPGSPQAKLTRVRPGLVCVV